MVTGQGHYRSITWLAVLCLLILGILAPSESRQRGFRPDDDGRGPIPQGLPTTSWTASYTDGLSNALLVGDVAVLTHGHQAEGRDAVTGRTIWRLDTASVPGYTRTCAFAVTGTTVLVLRAPSTVHRAGGGAGRALTGGRLARCSGPGARLARRLRPGAHRRRGPDGHRLGGVGLTDLGGGEGRLPAG
jgi:hypothetical protein